MKYKLNNNLRLLVFEQFQLLQYTFLAVSYTYTHSQMRAHTTPMHTHVLYTYVFLAIFLSLFI